MLLQIHDAIGVIGVACILLAYALLQTRRATGSDLSYLLLNLAGASLILVSLIYAFNLSAVLMESAWILITVYGLATRKRGRRGGLPGRPTV